MTRLPAVMGALFGLLLLSGCGASKPESGGPFGTQAPGRYMVGDSFTFDNPVLTWTVVSVEGEKVFWRSDKGDEQVTGHDPLMPALQWKNPGRGGGRRTISDVKGALFPLTEPGNMTFTSRVENWTMKDGQATPPQKWEYNWSCKVSGEETVEVPAGKFDTYKVICGRYKPTELEFFYSPEIGHYVVMRIDDPASESTITRNLLSYRRMALLGPDAEVILPPEPEMAPPPMPKEPEPAPPPPAPSVKELEPPKKPTVGTGSGPRAVLGAFSTEENAARAWGIYRKDYSDVLGGLSPQIKAVTFASQGTLFRLATERLESREAAKRVCNRIIDRGGECFVSTK
jgi:hypothetical protein